MAEEIETVDAELVATEVPRTIEPVRQGLAPVAVQAAAVAATGFAAGMVTVAAVRRRKVRKAAKRGPLGKIVGSRSFLVDVHVLDR
jgi:hypothetical protein